MPQRIGDDVRRGLRPQPPRAPRVAAAWGHLPRCASQLAPRRSQRGLRQYSDGLLVPPHPRIAHRRRHAQVDLGRIPVVGFAAPADPPGLATDP